MPGKYYINAHCIINNKHIAKNGVSLFRDQDGTAGDFLIAAYRHFGIQYPRFFKMDNLSKLGWLAAEILLKDSFQSSDYKPDDIGLILANANASLDTDIKYYNTVKSIPSPSLFVYTLPNIMTGEICIRHHFKGENAFFIFERFDADFIQQYVNNLINNNTLQACICGWVDLLDDHGKAVLFLIERESRKDQDVSAPVFSKENIIKIYQLENG